MYKIGVYYKDWFNNYYQCINIDAKKKFAWLKDTKGIITKIAINMNTQLYKKVSFFERNLIKTLFNN